jgi:hypothetical protein
VEVPPANSDDDPLFARTHGMNCVRSMLALSNWEYFGTELHSSTSFHVIGR